jgi:hypothetical protein
MVKNVTSTGGISTNSISGNPTFTYNGTLGAVTTLQTSTTVSQTYTTNISGWMEQW